MSKILNTTPSFWKFASEPVSFNAIGITFNENETCEWNIKAYSDPEGCNDNPVSPMFIEAEWLPIENEIEEEYKENGFGQQKLKRRVVKRVHQFRFIADEFHRYWFYELALIDDKIKLDIDTGSVATYDAFEISIEDNPIDDENNLFEIIVSFKTDSEGLSDFGSNSCCRPLYEGAPFEDPCSGEGGGGSVDCSAFQIQVQRSGDILNANVSGNQGSGYTIAWFYRPVGGSFTLINNNSSSISLGGYGTYRAVANEAPCSDQDQHEYMDPCSGFDVTITVDGDELIAEVENGGNGLTYVWEQYDSGTDSWNALPDTTPAIIAPEPGQFRVTVQNDAGCSDQDIGEVLEAFACDWTAEITESNDILEAVPSDASGTYTFAWFVDRGDGNGLIDLNTTTQTIAINGSGMYEVIITDDSGCQVPARYVVIDCNTECGNVGMLIKKFPGELAVEFTQQPNDVEILWFLDTGSGYKQIGTGTNINITLNGMYKVEARWGDGCVKSKAILVYDCDTDCANFDIELIGTGCDMTASATGGPGSPTYKWFKWDGSDWVTTGETGDTFTPTETGLYRVVATDGTCVKEKEFFVSKCDDQCEFHVGDANQIYVCN